MINFIYAFLAVLAQHLTFWLLQALFDLEATNQELKSDLRDLYITGAAEIDVGSSSRKAIIIHVCLLSSTLSASVLRA